MIAKLKPYLWIFASAILALAASALFSRLDDRLYDTRLPLRATHGWPKDVVFIPIDDDTLRDSGNGPWPWTRDKQAELLDRVHALGAKTIWYDVFLGVKGAYPVADDRLAESLSGVVLGIAGAAQSGETVERSALADALIDAQPARDDYRRIDQLVIPLDLFASHARGVGHSLVFPDGDGVSRSITPVIGISADGAHPLPGAVPLTPLVAFLAQRDLPVRNLRITRDSLTLPDGTRVPLHDGAFQLDFPADAAEPPQPRIAARELLGASAAKQATLRKEIEGKLAVVYMDNTFTADFLTIPNVAKKVPGGVVLATALRTFDSGRAPRRGSSLLALLALAAIGFAGAPWLWRQHPYRVLEVGGLAVIAVVAATALPVPLFDYFPPVVAPMAFVLVTTGVFSLLGLRSLDTQNRQLQSLVQAAKNVGSGLSNPVQQIAVQPPGADPPTRKVDGLGDAPTGSALTGGRHSHPSRDSAALLLQGNSLEEDIELGKYLIKRSLGRGGMGAIFLALDQELDRPVVIKLLDSADPTALLRFKREAHAVARINHPNVVQIYDFKTDTHPPYICMEYVGGGTLGDLLRDQDDKPVEWRRASRIIANAAAGLGAAHAKRMVHRDVKPANILLTDRRGDMAKVADFGIAKLADADALTTEGSFVGTIGYLAPEQAMGKEVDARSDVYSLALTWFRLLTGRRAFDGTTQEILRRTVEASIPDPRQLNPTVPLPVAELLLRMAELEPDRRPRDGKVVAEAIAAILPTEDTRARMAP